MYLDRMRSLSCYFCGLEFEGYIVCPKGHSVCEACHSQEEIRHSMEIFFRTQSTSPIEIFETMIGPKRVPMLGCHHAFMAAAAFLAGIRNQGTVLLPEGALSEVFNRTKGQAIGGYCGLTGVCGIATALGACFSVILGARCGTDLEQRLTMEVISRIVHAMAEITGPSCCRAYARRSLEVAMDFLEEKKGLSLSRPVMRIVCGDFSRHPHGCRQKRCPYFPET